MAQYANTPMGTVTVNVDLNVFPAGTYVVLLSTCNGVPKVWRDCMTIGFCYRLRKASDTYNFHVEQDNKGGLNNGWSVSLGMGHRPNQLKLRLASDQEVAEYNRLGKPYDVTKLTQIINDYQIY